jgi:hypothetical protein
MGQWPGNFFIIAVGGMNAAAGPKNQPFFLDPLGANSC